MKTLLLITCLISLTSKGMYAPEVTIECNSRDIHSLYYFHNHRAKLLHAMIMVESNYNPLAVNEQEGAVGVLQIREVMVRHVNAISGGNYTLLDRYDPIKSIAMWDSLMIHRNPSYNIDTALSLWNAGRKDISKAPQRVQDMVNIYKLKVYNYL